MWPEGGTVCPGCRAAQRAEHRFGMGRGGEGRGREDGRRQERTDLALGAAGREELGGEWGKDWERKEH